MSVRSCRSLWNGQRMQFILDRCLALQFKPKHPESTNKIDGHTLFQNFQAANSCCYWNRTLMEAVGELEFAGHVTPATVLVTGPESSLEVVRGAWTRKVLRAPSAYSIVLVGDVEGCTLQPIIQSQFTPLHEAICWVIWELNEVHHSASFTDVVQALERSFPELALPAGSLLYDTLSILIKERKIYYTGRGYSIVTPTTYTKTSVVSSGAKSLLLSNEEALALAHGSIESYPQGNIVHKAVQTNLLDVICRGDATDKVLYARSATRSDSPQRLHRQRSLKLFHNGSSANGLVCLEYRRKNSIGSLGKSSYKSRNPSEDLNSSTDYEDSVQDGETCGRREKEKSSIFNRLFGKRSSSRKRSSNKTFSAQFPPPDWTETQVLHLHSIGVQTSDSSLNTTTNEDSSADQEPVPLDWTDRASLTHSPYRGRPSSSLSTASTQYRRSTEKVKARASRSPATSVSSGLGRSFSPGSVRSYSRAVLGTPCPPSPSQSTDSFYSSLGPSASAIHTPRPGYTPKESRKYEFARNCSSRASYNGPAYRYTPSLDTRSEFQRFTPRSSSYRTPRSYTTISQRPGSRPGTPFTPAGSKKILATDLDFSVRKNRLPDQTATAEHSKNRVINICVTKSENVNFVPQQESNQSRSPETVQSESDSTSQRNCENFRDFPSLTELNINFKSITGQKILQGLESDNNSTDTLVEVNMRETENCLKNFAQLAFV